MFSRNLSSKKGYIYLLTKKERRKNLAALGPVPQKGAAERTLDYEDWNMIRI